jgi:hypothetical protein
MNTSWRYRNAEEPFGAFFEEGTVGFVVLMSIICVEKSHSSGTENLEPVMKIGSRLKILRAKAGTRIINFQEFDTLSGAIADRCRDVRGMTAGYSKKRCHYAEDEKPTHKNKAIRHAAWRP